MMTLVKLLFLSFVFLLLSCSTTYKIVGVDGKEVITPGKIERKIYFRSANGIPLVIEQKSIDSMYINSSKKYFINNLIFYRSDIYIAEGDTLSGYIIANNRFYGTNKKVNVDVPFEKISIIKKVK